MDTKLAWSSGGGRFSATQAGALYRVELVSSRRWLLLVSQGGVQTYQEHVTRDDAFAAAEELAARWQS